jgi:hypothetical protein
MTTVFISLAQALQTLLAGAPAVADYVVRDRFRPIPNEHNTQVVIRLDKTQGERAGTQGGPTDWGTLFVIDCYARCAANLLPSEVVDPIVEAAFARLSGAGAALNLDVEDMLPDPRIEWDLGEGETPLVCASFSVRIVHRTKASQLATWS